MVDARATARPKLDALGIDAVCDLISEGKSLTQIARSQKVSIGSLLTWIEADPERSARAREARAATAKVWDEKAEAEIRKAKNPLSLAKARELAHHFRWRAAKIAPAEYGEKIQQEHSGSVSLGDLIDAAAAKRKQGEGQ